MTSEYKRIDSKVAMTVIEDFIDNPRPLIQIAQDNNVSEHYVTKWTSVFSEAQHEPRLKNKPNERNELLDKFVVNDTLFWSFGDCKIRVEVFVEHKYNNQDIVFSHSELFLNQCNDVFAYWYENKSKFTVSTCSNATKISPDTVREIYDKYIK
jgi:hypothetical protein